MAETKQFDVASVLDARQAAFGGQRADELLNVLANRARLAQQQDFETQRILGAIAKIGFSAFTGNPFAALSGGKDLLGGKTGLQLPSDTSFILPGETSRLGGIDNTSFMLPSDDIFNLGGQ